ncbi:MAG: hypothetical protein NXI23_01855 [Bacteroidetes bacterium]|jgi:uncharacterized protein YyaL (SSP411 family)|nr:hypothetical protein [Bacteroidota bacterium]
MKSNIFHNQTKPTLHWLKKSIDATGQKGSAAFYSRIRLPLRGWEKAYPETTGYIIETLLNYHEELEENWLSEYALKCADWLCDIQFENGAFAELFGETGKESTFNTGQIIFGLIRAYEVTQNEKYFDAFNMATNWLSNSLDENGVWEKGLFVSNFVPSYNTRVIWAMLYANQYLNDPKIKQNARKALDFYKQKIQPNYAVKDWAFESNQPAFTHTIAYTIRGFLESAILLKDDLLLNKTIQMSKKLASLWNREKRFAGTYEEDWKGDYSFVCVTGNAQLSIIFSRLFQITKEEKWKTLAYQVSKTLKVSKTFLTNGAIPGSVPFWEKYMHFKYPNWAAKFYLDAFWEIQKNTQGSRK